MWYFAAEGARHGPYTEDEIRQRVEEGEITLTTLVWNKGMPEWIQASSTSLRSLFDDSPPPLPNQVRAAAVGSYAEEADTHAFPAPAYARPLRPLWRTLRLAFAVLTLSIAVQVGAALNQLNLLQQVESRSFASQEQMMGAANTADLLVQIANLLYIAVYIWAAFLFLKLTYRAAKNLVEANAQGMETSPRWAVGWYFVPILWLWKPLQAVRQIWRASSNPGDPRSVRVPSIIGWWWFFWILSGIIGYVSFRMMMRAGAMDSSGELNLDLFRDAQAIAIFSDLLTLPLIVTAALWWGKIVSMQDNRSLTQSS